MLVVVCVCLSGLAFELLRLGCRNSLGFGCLLGFCCFGRVVGLLRFVVCRGIAVGVIY